MGKYHLAFDLGAESGRAVVGELSGGKLKMTEIHRFETGITKMGGHMYCGVMDSYKAILKALRIFRESYGQELESIGVDSWGCDFGLLDGKGRLLSLPYSYRDRRVDNTEKIIEQKMGADKLYRLTGIQMLNINTLNQLLGMIKEGDQTLGLARNLLFVGDLMHYFLTGNIATEYTMLSISQIYDTLHKAYAEEVFDCFGLPRDIKTKLIYAGDAYGLLKPEIAEECGVSRAKVITPAVHDSASGFAAVQAHAHETWFGLSSGTWSVLGMELDEAVINNDTCRYSYSNSGGVLGKNLLLKNVMGLWIIQSCKREWEKGHPGLTYGEIVRLAQKAQPWQAYIDPDDYCFFNPDSMVASISQYLEKTGQRQVPGSDIGQTARIVYESLAFKYYYVMERMEKASGKKADVVYAIGGGNKNSMLNQFTANALGKKCVLGSSEACTMGNLLTQMYGCGLIGSLHEMRDIVRNSISETEYHPQNTEETRRKYAEFLSAVKLDSL